MLLAMGSTRWNSSFSASSSARLPFHSQLSGYGLAGPFRREGQRWCASAGGACANGAQSFCRSSIAGLLLALAQQLSLHGELHLGALPDRRCYGLPRGLRLHQAAGTDPAERLCGSFSGWKCSKKGRQREAKKLQGQRSIKEEVQLTDEADRSSRVLAFRACHVPLDQGREQHHRPEAVGLPSLHDHVGSCEEPPHQSSALSLRLPWFDLPQPAGSQFGGLCARVSTPPQSNASGDAGL
mmetsp:Transcript_85117/g.150541  ORF Transcript_85117/g.150541 Transcript_85117/m.150541 type:complete len:239 (-) Transcript_85117:794-1510(-)